MTFPRPDDHSVAVCWVDASPVTPEDASAWVLRLPQEEQDRFHRYRHATSAHEFLVGRLLIRGWLDAVSGNGATPWQLVGGERGRPEIVAPLSRWSFNLAHSGGLVACSLSHLPGVGVDLEDLARRPMARDLVRRFCAPAEIADIERQSDETRTTRFLTYWTLKEAYLKALGLGIAVHLADLEFTIDLPHPTIAFRGALSGRSTDWAFELFRPTDRYLLSVAVPQPAGSARPAISLHSISLAMVTR